MTGRYDGLDNMTEYPLQAWFEPSLGNWLKDSNRKHVQMVHLPASWSFESLIQIGKVKMTRLLTEAAISKEELSARELGPIVFKFETWNLLAESH
jgi:hypothetical protein